MLLDPCLFSSGSPGDSGPSIARPALTGLLLLRQVCQDDQYETWSVPTAERCLLGRNITMTRRKADSACFNGKGHVRPEGIHTYCDCEPVSSHLHLGSLRLASSLLCCRPRGACNQVCSSRLEDRPDGCASSAGSGSTPHNDSSHSGSTHPPSTSCRWTWSASTATNGAGSMRSAGRCPAWM